MKNCIIFPHRIKDSFIGTAKRLWKKGWFKNLFCSEKLGIGVEEPRTKLEIGGDGSILAIGTRGEGESLPRYTFWDKTVLYWYPKKVSFRVGFSSGGGWEEEYIGEGSIAMGIGPIAYGYNSVAIGEGTRAEGNHSIALGYYSTAGGGAIAIGINNYSGGDSIAIGKGAGALPAYSIAIGTGWAIAAAYPSIAIGKYVFAGGEHSLAMGIGVTTIGNFSFSIGTGLIARGEGSFIIGKGGESALINDIPNSLMVGFNSNIPTLIVTGGEGLDTFGKVGIGTTEPESTLDVNGDIKSSGNLEIEGELKIKVYYQDDEPILGTDQRLAMWIDTDDNNRVYLLFRRAADDQVAVELTAIEE